MPINPGSSALNDSGEFEHLALPFHTASHMPATDGGLPGSPFYKQGMNPKSSIVSNVMDAEDSLGPTGKRFTESLHERKNNGKFEESSNKKKPERN